MKKELRPNRPDQTFLMEAKRIAPKKVPAFITLFYRIAENVGGVAKAQKIISIKGDTLYQMKIGELTESKAKKILATYNKICIKK